MVIHVVFGLSAFGQLKNTINKSDDEIVCLQDDLTVGPLNNLDSSLGKNARNRWLANIFLSDYYVAGWKKDYIKINQLKKLKNEKIYIWIGPNSMDELGALRLLDNIWKCQLKNNSMNIMNKIYLVQFPIQKIAFDKIKYFAKKLGELPPTKAVNILKFKKELKNIDLEKLSKVWFNLSNSNSKLRIRKGAFSFIETRLDYYDKYIISACGTDFKPASMVIGILLGKIQSMPDDLFFFWRIRVLIKSKTLEGVGDFSDMKTCKIRKI